MRTTEETVQSLAVSFEERILDRNSPKHEKFPKTPCTANCKSESQVVHYDRSILDFIIQQIVTMPIYGQESLNICHLYMSHIQRFT